MIDLYFLTKSLGWSQIFADAERKRVPPAYDALEHILAQPVTGIALLVSELIEADYNRFVATLRAALTEEVKKKVAVATREIGTIVCNLLWDTPGEARTINTHTLPVLRRRVSQLALPERIALSAELSSFEKAAQRFQLPPTWNSTTAASSRDRAPKSSRDQRSAP